MQGLRWQVGPWLPGPATAPRRLLLVLPRPARHWRAIAARPGRVVCLKIRGSAI